MPCSASKSTWSSRKYFSEVSNVLQEFLGSGLRATLVWTMILSRGNAGEHRPNCISEEP